MTFEVMIAQTWPDALALLGSAFKAVGWDFLPILLLPILFLFMSGSTSLRAFSDAFIRLVDSFNYRLGEIIKWALPVLVLTIAFSVFALSIFGLSWTKLFESAEYLHAAIIMLGASATLLAGQHVRVDVFHTRMSPTQRALVDLCGYYALLLPVCLIILWNSESFIAFSWQTLEGSAEADGIRGEFLLKTLIPLFCIFMIAQGLAIAMRAAFLINGYNCPKRPDHTPPLFGQQELEH